VLGAFHLGQPGMGSLLLVAAGPVAIYLIGGLVILAFREGPRLSGGRWFRARSSRIAASKLIFRPIRNAHDRSNSGTR
jgi:hypothetical protein